MKKLFFTGLLILISASYLWAQKVHDKFEEIQAIKIGYISKKLNLTPEQATVFWPIYNEFEQQNRTLRKQFAIAYHKENPDASRKEAMEYINADIKYQEEKLALRKKLVKSLEGNISEQQIADLFVAEREFRAMLLKRLHNKNANRRR